MDIVFLGIFYKLSRLYLCVGVDREYLPQERLCTCLCQECRIMTRDHLINFSDWNFLDFNEGMTINFQDRFFPPIARARLGI